MTLSKSKKSLKYVDKVNKDSDKKEYVREEPLTVYKSGNSKVVTIPSDFPFEIGDKLDASYKGGLLTLKKKSVDIWNSNNPWHLELRKFIEKHGFHGGADLSIDELEEFLEGIYD